MTETIDVRNPRTGEFDYQIEVADDATIEAAAARLRAGQREWLDMGVTGRIEVLQRWKQAIVDHTTEIRDAVRADTGRRFVADRETNALVGFIDRWCTDAPELFETRSNMSKTMPDVELRGLLDPYPLLGVISPWNFPLLLSFIDAIPALLAGCAVMIKPSEVTPRFAKPVSDTIARVPEMEAVLQFVSGDGRSGAALIRHVDAIVFTGSVATGRKVAAAAAEQFIPVFLELGGKDPAIVLEGSDVERAATSILRASVASTGQACQSIERVYVHDSIYDDFVAAIAAKAAATPLSFPDPDAGIVGPLIFDRQADIIDSHIKDAVDKGAKVLTGGEIHEHGGGKWVEPTVLVNVDHSMQVMTDETFGPVIPIMPFATEAEAVQLANDSRYGLSGAIFAPSDEAAERVASQLDVGGISINDAAMTSMIHESEKNSFKLSGMGQSRMGATGLTRFFRHKALFINRGAVMPIEATAEGQ